MSGKETDESEIDETETQETETQFTEEALKAMEERIWKQLQEKAAEGGGKGKKANGE